MNIKGRCTHLWFSLARADVLTSFGVGGRRRTTANPLATPIGRYCYRLLCMKQHPLRVRLPHRSIGIAGAGLCRERIWSARASATGGHVLTLLQARKSAATHSGRVRTAKILRARPWHCHRDKRECEQCCGGRSGHFQMPFHFLPRWFVSDIRRTYAPFQRMQPKTITISGSIQRRAHGAITKAYGARP
jgi:hypothetical protein